ncbi:hypothetical protein ACC691_40645, partial [Rhizobium johnstonii]
VVVELRRLNQENDELRQRLSAAETRGADAPAAVAPVPSFAEPVPAPVPVPVAAAASVEDDQTSTTNLLQLARRLHEEHVRE